jgi:hypothetical protein
MCGTLDRRVETIQLCCCAAVLVLVILSGSLRAAESNRVAALLARNGKTSEAAADPLAKQVLTSLDFELMGGWRVPPATRQPNYHTLAWGNGGLAVRVDGAALRFYTTHHNHLGGPIQGLVTTERPGAAKTPVTAWPLLQVGEHLGDLYRAVRESHPDTAQPECTGVFFDGARVITTGRAAYAVPPPEGPFLCVDGHAYGVQAGSPQLLGGGLCDIPQWFADRFLEGRSLGVGLGGYCSGQGSSTGPSLYACARALSESTPAKPLLRFGTLGTTDATLRERRPPDYHNAANVWSLDPDGETGYWAADRVLAGPVWIETEQKAGVCYWALQGCGKLEYTRQTETFGETAKIRLYVYSPQDLADVAQGRKRPHEPRGAFFEWNQAGVPGSVHGACWLPESRTLFLLLAAAYPDGEEQLPAIAAYRVR